MRLRTCKWITLDSAVCGEEGCNRRRSYEPPPSCSCLSCQKRYANRTPARVLVVFGVSCRIEFVARDTGLRRLSENCEGLPQCRWVCECRSKPNRSRLPATEWLLQGITGVKGMSKGGRCGGLETFLCLHGCLEMC